MNTLYTLRGAYTDPSYLHGFSGRDGYRLSWRCSTESWPIEYILNSVGGAHKIPGPLSDVDKASLLARHGVRNVRIEIPWHHQDWNNPLLLSATADTSITRAVECIRRGIRVMILLGFHEGAPCPYLTLPSMTLAVDMAPTDRSVEVVSVPAGIVPGYSGLSSIWLSNRGKFMCGHIIESVDGNTLHLSQEVGAGDPGNPEPMTAGRVFTAHTLKYRPFGDAVTWSETLGGFLDFGQAIVQRIVDATGRPDMLSIEYGNELTFGSNFLDLNMYVVPNPGQAAFDAAVPAGVYGGIENGFGDLMEANEALYGTWENGVRSIYGFGSQSPFQSSEYRHPRTNAHTHHIYGAQRTFPKDDGQPVFGIFGDIEAIGGDPEPICDLVHVEVEHCNWRPETPERDVTPVRSLVLGVPHGRYSSFDGKARPVVPTEMNMAPAYLNTDLSDPGNVGYEGYTESEASRFFKALGTARYYTFMPTRGMPDVLLYGFLDHTNDDGLNLLPGALTQDLKDGTVDGQTVEVGMMLRVWANIREIAVAPPGKGALRIDPTMELNDRPLTVEGVWWDHLRETFDSVPEDPVNFPAEKAGERLFVGFWMVNGLVTAIPIYEMTHDMRQRMTGESYTVKLSGFAASTIDDAEVRWFDSWAPGPGDPGGVRGISEDPQIEELAVTVDERGTEISATGATVGYLKVTLDVADYPRVLIVDEGPSTGTPAAVPASMM